MDKNEDYIIFSEDKEITQTKHAYWKVLIVDDEIDIHDVTKIVLKNFEFENKSLQFLSAYTLPEAKKIMRENPDTALILLDIVMEEEDSGLKLVKYLRDELKNSTTRIILRTGQPGSAPQSKVVIDYDINDYKEKTELTKEKFFSSVVMALRSFKVMQSLTDSLDQLKSRSKAIERLVPVDYLSLLDKKNLADIKPGDIATHDMTVIFLNVSNLVHKNHLTPKNNIQLINTCIKFLEPVITEQHGVIDTFMGEAIMAIFYGAPDNVIKACINMIRHFQKNYPDQNQAMQIGFHSGLLTFGTIGHEGRINYTAIGEAITLAARLEGLNNHYHSVMLISEDAIKKLSSPEDFNFRWIANYKEHDQSSFMRVYEIFDMDNKPAIQLKNKTKGLFEDALSDYLENQYQNARKKFNEVIETNPDDLVASTYLTILDQQAGAIS